MWIRNVQITAAGQTWQTEPPPGTGLRLRFTIKFWTNNGVNTCVAMITNPLRSKADAFAKSAIEGQPITITAGYYDGTTGTLFDGTISEATYGRESPTDTILSIYGANGNWSQRYGNVNKLLPAGSTPKDIAQAAHDAMKAVDPGIKSIFFDPALQMDTPKYPRSIPLFGPARHFLNMIMKSKSGHWFTNNGDTKLLRTDSTLPGGAIELNSHTGLIGMPSQTIGGIVARTLIRPEIVPGSMVHIDQSSITIAGPTYLPGSVETNPIAQPDVTPDGNYKVFKIDVEGDTRGQSYYMDLTMAKIGETNLTNEGKIYSTIPGSAADAAAAGGQ